MKKKIRAHKQENNFVIDFRRFNLSDSLSMKDKFSFSTDSHFHAAFLKGEEGPSLEPKEVNTK